MNSEREVIARCAVCGGDVVWLPIFGDARDLGACLKCDEYRYVDQEVGKRDLYRRAPQPDAAMSDQNKGSGNGS